MGHTDDALEASTARQRTDEDHGSGLLWVALFLTRRRCIGAEEGGIWTDQGTLITDRGLYGKLGAGPAAFLNEADATAYADRMREALPALNEGRRPLHSVLSDGIYDVLIAEADLLPLIYPENADACE